MKKRIFGRKFSRAKKGRLALLRSLTRSLVLSGKTTTTKARAKAVSGQIDKYFSRAKKGGVALRRKILAEMGNDRQTVDALFARIAKVGITRKSGFTKITLLPWRRGDAAEMARLEWTDEIVVSDKKNEDISTKAKRS
jgi:large subunit ribosomal protein L17